MQTMLKHLIPTVPMILLTLATGGCPAPSDTGADGLPGGSGSSADLPSGGGGASDDKNDLLSTLFVIGPNMSLIGFDRAASLNNLALAPTTDLALSHSTVIAPRDAAIDANGALHIISGAAGGSIAIYNNPLTATGSRLPDRRVLGPATKLANNPTGIAIDRAASLLYVSNLPNEIAVFDISQPAVFTGDVAPLRTFSVNLPGFAPEQIRFAGGSLYVVDVRGGAADIHVFDAPSLLQGPVTPDRTITHAGFDDRIGIEIEPKGRLLVAARDIGTVLIFASAAALDGAVTPDVEISISGAPIASKPSFATIDREDRLYIADANGNTVFAFDLASSLISGGHFAERTIKSTEFVVPNRLVLYER